MIVGTLMVLILAAVYKIFISQAKTISVSMESMKVNDQFRRIQSFMGDDVREATTIVFPGPEKLMDTPNLPTPKAPCRVLHVLKQEVDPSAKYVETTEANPVATTTYGQVVRVREIIYELKPYRKEDDPQATVVPRYKLMRTEYIKERDTPSTTLKQELEIADTIRDLVIFRTLRNPMKAADVDGASGSGILQAIPSSSAGTGNNLIHLKVSLERSRDMKGDLYEISLTTSFYKRGKEVFFRQ